VEEVVVAHVNEPLTPPNQVIPEISQPCSDALLRAMAKNPADRFQSYDEFSLALQAARSILLIQQYNQGGQGKSGKGWWRRGSNQ
jgi:serine/threonine-protein kinase